MASGLEVVATKEDVRKEVAYLIEDIRQNKRDVIKWMFIFWLGQVGATLAIVFLYLKK
jgi:hypothetical protein